LQLFRVWVFNGYMKSLHFIIGLGILALVSSVSRASEKDTADYLCADPYSHLDQAVVVKVLSVHPEHFESVVKDVVWFRAFTGSPSTQGGQFRHKQGGEIMVAVDSASGAAFFHTYGKGDSVRTDGYVQAHSLTGIFRACDKLLAEAANTRRVDQVHINNGLYFIDCTTNGQFTHVDPVTPTPTPTPAVSPTPSTNASTSSGQGSYFTGSIKSLMNRLGISK